MGEDWGLTLPAPGLSEGITHVGLRMHDIVPAAGDGVPCRVVEETETPFTYVAALIPEGGGGGTPLCMELPKADWLEVRAERLAVHIPPDKLLWLRP